MKVAVFDTHSYDRAALVAANAGKHELKFFEVRLGLETVELASGCKAVCCFVNDRLDAAVIARLAAVGVRLIALRSAGFNNVDSDAVEKHGLKVVRVPEYSPHAVAEHAVALLMTFNRKIHKAHARVHDCNFSLEGLVGFDLAGKTVGVVGTGRIGKVFAKIMKGFDAKVLCFDSAPEIAWARSRDVEYVGFEELIRKSDVISLHVPLGKTTYHLVAAEEFTQMKPTAILVNTGRGALIDTKALITALKKKTIAGACLDVYEEEEGVFFSDLSQTGVDDDLLARLTTFPNVLITSHQAFLTNEALANIATTTIASLNAFETST